RSASTTARCPLFVVILLRQPLELFQEDQRAVRRDLEPLAARLTGDVIVHPDQMILDLFEHRPVARISSAGNLGLPGAAHPADAVVIGAPAARALEAGRPLLGLFGKELAFVHRFLTRYTNRARAGSDSAAVAPMAESTPPTLPSDRLVLLLLQHSEADDPTPDDVHRVGTVGIVRQMAKAGGGINIIIEGIAR